MKAIRNATLISLAVAALALVAVAPVAYAASFTVVGTSIADTTSVTSNMGTLSVGGFQSAPGYVAGDTLTGVEIILSGDGTTQFHAELLGFNISGPPNPVSGTPGSVTLNSFNNTTTLTLSGLTPALVLTGTASAGGTVLSSIAPSNSDPYSSDITAILGSSVDDYPAIIATYDTAGNIYFTLSGTANSNANTSGLTDDFSISTSGTTYAGASIEAIYDYSPPSDTPEPGTLTLFGSGLLGLAGMLRRKLMLSR